VFRLTVGAAIIPVIASTAWVNGETRSGKYVIM
jgi:hypothetical protein